jgi:DNA-binding transcriptional MerR regulator
MLIGELVERTGLTKDTIRFYEKKDSFRWTKKAEEKTIIRSTLNRF